MDYTAPIDIADHDGLPEIPACVVEEIASWRRIVRKAPVQFERAAVELIREANRQEPGIRQAIIDEIAALGADAAVDRDEVQRTMAAAFSAPPDLSPSELAERQRRRPINGEAVRAPEPPPPKSPDDYCALDATPLPRPVTAAAFTTPGQWPNEEPPPVDWLAAQRIPRGDVCALHGDGGAGKTDVALRLAANVARGAPDWLGDEIASGPVVIVSAEELEREIRRRLWLHGKRDGYSPGNIAKLHLWFPERDAPDTALAVPDRTSGIMRPTPLFDSIAAGIVAVQPVLVVVDNVAATFAGNQNDRVMVRTYVNLWRAVARINSRPAVLLIDHPSLSGLTSGSGRGGNTDWRNAVRSALYLRLPEEKVDVDRGIRVLETMKSNYGPSGPKTQLRLQWTDGGLEREASPTSLHRLAKDAECEAVFLRLLDERNGQGSHVGRKTSSMYAPKVFAAMPNNGGFTKHALADAMERLFAVGTVREVWDAKRRHDYIDRAESVEISK